MKVIMLQDVKKVGKKDEIVDVKDGYALNFLIPNKLAVKYTKGSIKVLDAQNQAIEEKKKQLEDEAKIKKEKLESITLEFKAKTSNDGRMIGTISYKQVEKELKDKYDIEIDKRKIIDKFQINAFGVTLLKIELYKNVIGSIKVHVSEEK